MTPSRVLLRPIRMVIRTLPTHRLDVQPPFYISMEKSQGLSLIKLLLSLVNLCPSFKWSITTPLPTGWTCSLLFTCLHLKIKASASCPLLINTVCNCPSVCWSLQTLLPEELTYKGLFNLLLHFYSTKSLIHTPPATPLQPCRHPNPPISHCSSLPQAESENINILYCNGTVQYCVL